MKKSVEQFIGSLRTLRLTDAEKAGVATSLGFQVRNAPKERLLTHMNRDEFLSLARSVRLSPAERTIIKEAILETASREPLAWVRRFSTIFASVLIIAGGGGGLAFASESALPGSFLYPVKVHVTEAVRAAFIMNPESAAAWSAERAERRLREAELLVERNDLDEEKLALIRRIFKKHSLGVQENIAAIATTDANVAGARGVGADFEAGLHAHVKTLMLLKQKDKAPLKELDLLLTDVEDARLDTEAATINVQIEGGTDEGSNPASFILSRVSKRLSEAEASGMSGDAWDLAKEKLKKAEESGKDGEKLRLARQALRQAREAGLGHANAGASVGASTAVQMNGNSDLVFETRARMRMTERKLQRMEVLMNGLKDPLPEEVSTGLQSEITVTEELMNTTRKQMDAGDADAALETANSALQNASKAQQGLEVKIGIGGE